MRKNLRGLSLHLEELVERISDREFEGSFYECHFNKGQERSVLAWATEDGIYFNLKGARDFYLAASERQLRNLARHEIIHFELEKGLVLINGQWCPRGNRDSDLDFEEECRRRGVPRSLRLANRTRNSGRKAPK